MMIFVSQTFGGRLEIVLLLFQWSKSDLGWKEAHRIESKSKTMAQCEKKGAKNIPKRKGKALGNEGETFLKHLEMNSYSGWI